MPVVPVAVLEPPALLTRVPVHELAPRALHVHHVARVVRWPPYLLLQVLLLRVPLEKRLVRLVLLLHPVVLPPFIELLQKVGVHLVGLRGLETLPLHPKARAVQRVAHLATLPVRPLLLLGAV